MQSELRVFYLAFMSLSGDSPGPGKLSFCRFCSLLLFGGFSDSMRNGELEGSRCRDKPEALLRWLQTQSVK